MSKVNLSLENLEVGKLYFKVIDFEDAIAQLKQGMNEARAAEDWSHWCQHLPLLLRIHAERMDFDAIAKLRAELADLKAAGKLTVNSATQYTLGIAASYEGKAEQAEQCFQLALDLSQNILESGQARFGLATVQYQRRNYIQAIAMLQKLEADLRPTLLVDLKLATGLSQAFCYRCLGDYGRAFQLLGPLQELCRVEKNLYMSLNILFCYGTIYQDSGEPEKARQYYEMVQSLLVERDLRHTAQQVERRMSELGHVLEMIEGSQRLVITPKGQRVHFGNQFILMDLLKMLALEPGVKLSKEDIVQRLWKEDYNPLIHDNKIYVTIRRLRKMIEPDMRKPSYILSVPDGYLFNPEISFKVHA